MLPGILGPVMLSVLQSLAYVYLFFFPLLKIVGILYTSVSDANLGLGLAFGLGVAGILGSACLIAGLLILGPSINDYFSKYRLWNSLPVTVMASREESNFVNKRVSYIGPIRFTHLRGENKALDAFVDTISENQSVLKRETPSRAFMVSIPLPGFQQQLCGLVLIYCPLVCLPLLPGPLSYSTAQILCTLSMLVLASIQVGITLRDKFGPAWKRNIDEAIWALNFEEAEALVEISSSHNERECLVNHYRALLKVLKGNMDDIEFVGSKLSKLLYRQFGGELMKLSGGESLFRFGSFPRVVSQKERYSLMRTTYPEAG